MCKTPGLPKVELVPRGGCVTRSWRACVRRGPAVWPLVGSHSQATLRSCLLIPLRVPCIGQTQARGQRAFWCDPYRQHPGSESSMEKEKEKESESGEADGRCLGHGGIPSDCLLLVVRYLWKSRVVMEAVLWSQRVWPRIISAPPANWASLSSSEFPKPVFPHHIMGVRLMLHQKVWESLKRENISVLLTGTWKRLEEAIVKCEQCILVKLFFYVKQIQLCFELIVAFFVHCIFLYFRFPTVRKRKTSIRAINKYVGTALQIMIVGWYCALCLAEVCELAATAELAWLWTDRRMSFLVMWP